MNRVFKPFARSFRSTAFKSFHTDPQVLPPVGTMWRHYKGDYYRIEGYCVREADTKLHVLYTNYYNPEPLPWARPFEEWNQTVEHDKRRVSRFSYTSPA